MSRGGPLRWYQQLRWRLPVSYLLLAIAPFVVGIAIGATLDAANYRARYAPATLEAALTAKAPGAAPLLASPHADAVAVSLWLKSVEDDLHSLGRGRAAPDISRYSTPSIAAVITDGNGTVLAALPASSLPTGEALAARLPEVDATLVSSALRGEADGSRLSARAADDALVSAVPVWDASRRVVGALYARVHAPYEWRTHLGGFVAFLWGPVRTHTLLAAVFALCFGLLAARNLTSRLERISAAAAAWGRGEFSAVIEDRSADEVGQLAHRLNAMASELREVVALRQELATLEERNRLARDLHDTIKQQVFALAMQIGAARATLGGDRAALDRRLAEADKLAGAIQQELVAIIKELQPPSRTGKSFSEAAREYVADWSRQSGIAAEVAVERARSLPPEVEQAFFRVMQEALANVLRHSGATSVLVRVDGDTRGKVELSITDNGSGFDPARVNGGMGLRNMRARAEALPGGSFEIEGRKGKGTRVTVRFDPSAAK